MDNRLVVLLMTNTLVRNSLVAHKANAGKEDGRNSNILKSPLKVFQHTLPSSAHEDVVPLY